MTQPSQYPYRAVATNRHRADWSARYTVYATEGLPAAQRVRGDLYRGTALVRSFDVALSPEAGFATDIGTGSGVKVSFHHRGEADATRITVDAGIAVPLIYDTTVHFNLRDALTGRVVAAHRFPDVTGPGTREYHHAQR